MAGVVELLQFSVRTKMPMHIGCATPRKIRVEATERWPSGDRSMIHPASHVVRRYRRIPANAAPLMYAEVLTSATTPARCSGCASNTFQVHHRQKNVPVLDNAYSTRP